MKRRFGNYRVTNITRITNIAYLEKDIFKNMPIKYGLGIERECEGEKNKNNFFVVSFVRYNQDEKEVFLEPLGSRIFDYGFCAKNPNDLKDFIRAVRFAKIVVEKANRKC